MLHRRRCIRRASCRRLIGRNRVHCAPAARAVRQCDQQPAGPRVLADHRHHVCRAAAETKRAAGHHCTDGGEDEGDEGDHPPAPGDRGQAAGGGAGAGPATVRKLGSFKRPEENLMGEHRRRRPVTETPTNRDSRGLNTAEPALFCTELRTMTIYFQQVELIFRRPEVKSWLASLCSLY